MNSIKIARRSGWLLIAFGVVYILLTSPLLWEDHYASSPFDPEISHPTEKFDGDDDHLGWGALLLGFLTLASSHYFKLKAEQRANRREAREVHDRRIRGEDVH